MSNNVPKQSTISDRIAEIRRIFCENNNNKFSILVGIPSQQASNYCNGTKNPGSKMIDKILIAFPQVSKAWLILGEGRMLRTEYADEAQLDNLGSTTTNRIHSEPTANQQRTNSPSATVGGDNNGTVTAGSSLSPDVLAMLRKRDEQIDRLLAIIENMQK